MRRTALLTVRAVAAGVLVAAVPFVAHAQGEQDTGGTGGDVGIDVEIAPTSTPPATDGPTDPTAPPATDPTSDPTDPTSPPAEGELGQTGFTGLPVILAAAGLVALGGGVLLYRRRLTS